MARGSSTNNKQPAEITDAQETEIKESFDLFKNENGKMDHDQIKFAFRALGIEPLKDTLENQKKKDSKPINYITFLELILPYLSKKNRLSTLDQAFTLFDKDSNGKISFLDLKKVAMQIGDESNDRELFEMIEFADSNGDGGISKDEFITLMTTASKTTF